MLRVGHYARECPEGEGGSDVERGGFGGGTSHHQRQKESSVHREARGCHQAPLIDEVSMSPTEQAKGGDRFGPSFGEKEEMTQKTDRRTKEQMNKNDKLLPSKNGALNKASKELSFKKFKNLVENGLLSKEDFDKMDNVREVVIPNRGKVIQFLQYEKSKGSVNIKALDINDLRNVQDCGFWGNTGLGRLSDLVKQNISQRGTEYFCHQCKVTYGGSSPLVDHLLAVHSLWMEQAGYSENLSKYKQKQNFFYALMALCDPKLQIEKVILKSEEFNLTDSHPFKSAGGDTTPLKRKEAQNESESLCYCCGR